MPQGKKATSGKKKRGGIPKKKPEFSLKTYIEESVASISNFFSFVFAGDFAPRRKELMDASIVYLHYN